jgi:hypothetical protein
MAVTSTHHEPPQVAQQPASREPALRWDRTVIGLLVAAAGTGWLLAELGVAVPWHLAPAAALVVVGVALLLSLLGGRDRAGLVVLGVVLTVVAIGVGVGADRFAGPVGDRVLVPGPTGWPAATRIAAGTVTIDLTRAELPAAGRLDVGVGAGRVVLRLPAEPRVRVQATVVMGTVVVDGEAVQQGVDLDWSDPAPAPAPPTVVIDLGAGDLEVSHARP